jgi:glycine oxidase
VRTWDVIVVGGGIIGLSLSIELRKRGASVLVVERGEPGHEASHAAAGMLVGDDPETAAPLRPLTAASAGMYPEFVHELQDESGCNVDLRDHGTLLLSPLNDSVEHGNLETWLPFPAAELEPALGDPSRVQSYVKERSVDPRALVVAALKATKHRGVDIASGTAVNSILLAAGRVAGVSTDRTSYHAAAVVNCAGAWAGQFPALGFSTRPVKGQMLAVVGGRVLRHVIRAPEVYLVPRTDGRILIGATVEEAGYDKRTVVETIQRMHRAALGLVSALGQARILESWAGLRPGTPDNLPILGATTTPGYFVATGHFRDGILLAPITAEVMAQVINGEKPQYDITAFSPSRFER